MDTILVPLDGSDLSASALPYAGFFGKLLGAKIHLVHVVTEGDEQDFVIERERLAKIETPAGTIEATGKQALLQHAAAYLEQQAAQLREQNLAVETTVEVGKPAQAIVADTTHDGAGMIVMATHGRGSIGRWLVGSVAHKLLRLTDIPILAVRGPAPEQPALRRIVVPLDGSPLAREALPMALDMAKRGGATLILLTVLAPWTGLDPTIQPPPDEGKLNELRERLLHELDDAMTNYRDVPVTTVIGTGFVGDTICREAERQEADLIVMSAHGHSGLRRFALGSVTDKVLHGTRVPTLVIHSSETKTSH